MKKQPFHCLVAQSGSRYIAPVLSMISSHLLTPTTKRSAV